MVFATHSLLSLYNCVYSLSPCGQSVITDTPIILIAAKSPVKTNYRRSTEINSRCYRLSLCGQQLEVPTVSRIKEVDSRGSRSHPRGIGNGYGIGGVKNFIFPTVNRNRKRNGIGNARFRTCSLPFKTLLVLWLLIYGGPLLHSWRREYKDQEALGDRI